MISLISIRRARSVLVLLHKFIPQSIDTSPDSNLFRFFKRQHTSHPFHKPISSNGFCVKPFIFSVRPETTMLLFCPIFRNATVSR